MRPPFRLVESTVSTDTVEVLRELLTRARRGEILGVVVVSVERSRQYEFALTGEAARSPTFSLGAVTRLQFDIAKRIGDS